jgi:beta-glucanase (GH16 family)
MNMIPSRWLHALLMALAVSLPVVPSQADTAWTLVWSDEFSQPDGSAPDATKWNHDLGGNGWGNNELQTYTSRTNNARIESGQLVIEARAETYTGTDGIQRNYTSARLKTQGLWACLHGRIEARIRVPRGQGIWPAFWMLGTNIASVGWPGCGEIDIMENIGREPSTVHGTIHGPGYSGAGGIGAAFNLAGGAPFADDFHVFAVEWTTNLLRWYVDGQLYFNATPGSLPAGSTWVFTQPQFLILNVAVGGDWPGYPDGTTTFPQRMTVDYVRAYAPADFPGCGGNSAGNPGFEASTLANWTTYGAGFNTLLGNVASLPVHGGTNVFKVFGQFTGGDNYSGVFQDVPCAGGASFTSEGWALTQGADKIAGGNTAWIEVSFRDAPGNILAIYRSALVTNTTPADTWINLAVTNRLDPLTFAVIGTTNSLVAPAGAVFARVQVVFRQPLSAGGAVLFDDLNLLASGDSDTPVPAIATRAGSSLDISFPTFLGMNYQVRRKSDLGTGLWLVLTNMTGDGATKSAVDPMTGSRQFYHVMRICN